MPVGVSTVPLILSSFLLARDSPETVFQNIPSKVLRRLLMQLFIVCIFFIDPALVVSAYETNKRELARISKKNGSEEELMRNIKMGKTLQQHFLQFLKLELGCETVYQAIGQISLLLSPDTETPTTNELERMFQKSSFIGIPGEGILIISILLSLKSTCSILMKIVKMEKPLSPTTPKHLIYFFAYWSSSKRVLISLLFFIPFFWTLQYSVSLEV